MHQGIGFLTPGKFFCKLLLALAGSLGKIANASAKGAEANQPLFRKNRSVLASGPLACMSRPLG